MTIFLWGLLIGYLIGNIGAFFAICLFLNKRINEQSKPVSQTAEKAWRTLLAEIHEVI